VNDVRRVPAAESEFVAIVLALVRGREGLAALLGR
jgi:hypothetical protein